MANYERGMYEPSDEVRVFDGAEDEDDVEGSRLPLLIVLALLVLAMFGGVVWLAYVQGVARGRGETPVLAAAPGPARIAPQNPGGSNVPYQGFKIYEQPAPPDDQADSGAPPAPRQAAKPAAPPARTPVPAAAPAQKAVLPPPPVMKKAVNTPPPAAPTPARVATAPTPAPVLGPATGAPRQLPGVASMPQAAAPVTASAAKPKASGGYVLQIGAYKSQQDADAAWKTYKARHAALLSGYGPDVQKADLGDKGVWYRLRVAGFGDREVASALCDRLKADGGGCFLGK